MFLQLAQEKEKFNTFCSKPCQNMTDQFIEKSFVFSAKTEKQNTDV